VTHKCVILRGNESWPIQESVIHRSKSHTHTFTHTFTIDIVTVSLLPSFALARARSVALEKERVVSHIPMCVIPYARLRRVTHANVKTHGNRHDTHTNASCHTYEHVGSRIGMRHVTHTSKSFHTIERVMSHIRASHFTQSSESCHAYECVTSGTGGSS